MNDFDASNLPVTCQKCGKQVPQSQANIRPNGQVWCKECTSAGSKKSARYLMFAGVGVLIALILVAIVVSSSGKPKSGLTYENYLKVQNGMTYTEVCDIFGQSGIQQSNTEAEGYSLTVYSWEKNSTFSYANVVVMFENGKVTSKSQVGLQ